MDQNFNNYNQNSGNNGNNTPYSNPFDQSQQNVYNSYEQNNQQNFGQQYQQPYGQPQQNYNQPYANEYQTPQYSAYGQQYGPMYQEDKSIKRFAVASLVLSIVSLFCCGFITSALGITFASISLKKQPANNGLAKAGLIIGIIGFIGTIISTIFMNCTGGYETLVNDLFGYYMGLL